MVETCGCNGDANHLHQVHFPVMGLLRFWTPYFKWGKVASKAYAGYRYTHLEYKDNPLDVKVTVKGPLVGIGFDF